MSNPSRFDTRELLSGWEGQMFNNDCLQPYCNRYQCDIRTSDTLSLGLLAATKGILLLGERAMKEWTTGNEYSGYTLNEQRGCPLNTIWKLPCVASYLPRDCVDMVNWERKLNPDATYENSETKNEDSTEETKRKGKTQWSNYSFWLQQDTQKLLRRIFSSPNESSGSYCYPLQKVLSKRIQPLYVIYPNSTKVIDELSYDTTKGNRTLVLDIETNSSLGITCFGFCYLDSLVSSETITIYVVPCFRYNGGPAYGNLPQIFRALAVGLQRSLVVTHNSQFDLLVLAHKYKLPIGNRHYDTMLSMHRSFPEVEKSLGHCMSLFTWEPYHKDEGIFEPKSSTQEHSLWAYNGKDVYGTALVYLAQLDYAARIPGLTDSIAQSNNCIRPYLISTLQGIRYSQTKLLAIVQENDRWLTQYLRMIRIVMGDNLFWQIKGKSKANIATSSKMCVEYFHNYLGYSPVKRTPDKKPSLDADALYKLKLKYPDNPMIDLILKFREKAKESSMLKFVPWRTP